MKVCPTHPTPNLGCGPVPPCPPAGPQQVLLGHTLVWMMRDKLALPLVNTVRAGNDTSLSSPLPPPAVSPLSTPNCVTRVNSQLCHPGQLPTVSPRSTPNCVTLVNSQLCHPGQLPTVSPGSTPNCVTLVNSQLCHLCQLPTVSPLSTPNYVTWVNSLL